MKNNCNKPIVHLICGQIGSGKTTLAKKIEKESSAIRFTPDEWMLKLYPELPDKEDFDSYYYRCCDIAWSIAIKIIELGNDVILDFGFWKYIDRKEYVELIYNNGAIPKLYYTECNKINILNRLKHRNKVKAEGAIYISEDMFNFYSPGFEPPNEYENYTLIRNDS